MLAGYHLRFLKVDEAATSIEGADIVRVPPFGRGADTFGVRLLTQPTPPPPSAETVLRLRRETGESEQAFLQRAFREAARHRRVQ